MNKLRFLLLPLLISLLVAAHAQKRIPGNACFVARAPSPEDIPIQFQRRSNGGTENLEGFELTRMGSPPEFRGNNSLHSDAGSPSKWALNWRVTPEGYIQSCGWLEAKKNARKGKSANQTEIRSLIFFYSFH